MDGVASPKPNPKLGGPGFSVGFSFPLATGSGYLEAPDTCLSPLFNTFKHSKRIALHITLHLSVDRVRTLLLMKV